MRYVYLYNYIYMFYVLYMLYIIYVMKYVIYYKLCITCVLYVTYATSFMILRFIYIIHDILYCKYYGRVLLYRTQREVYSRFVFCLLASKRFTVKASRVGLLPWIRKGALYKCLLLMLSKGYRPIG